jgi:hypothetical protein
MAAFAHYDDAHDRYPEGQDMSAGMTRRSRIKNTAAVLCVLVPLAALAPAVAQEWPTRPLTLVVPFTAGGGTDISARLQAQAIGDILGQTIIIENIGGGAGMTAGIRVARAAPDGYTFIIGNTGTHAYNQSLYKTPLYNAVTDFTPVGLVTESPRILNVRNDLPANGLRDFVAWLKANEDKAQLALPASAPARTCHACCSTSPSVSTSPTCPIAAPALPCRTSSADASTTCATPSRAAHRWRSRAW